MEYTINIKGRLMDLNTPQVMGILNVTPDSFYSASSSAEDNPVWMPPQQSPLRLESQMAALHPE